MAGSEDAAAGLPAEWNWAVEAGFHVLPLRRGSKLPQGAWAAFRTKRASQNDLHHWAEKGENLGIVTGQASDLLVLDLDNDRAVEEAERRGLPITVRVKTPRGQHVYFKHSAGIKNRVSIFEGADLRGDGGYVVCPGSWLAQEGGGRAFYRWMAPPQNVPIADAPDWLVELARSNPKPESVTPAAAPWSVRPRLEEQLATLRAAPPGTRNDELNRLTYILARQSAGQSTSAQSAIREAVAKAALAAGLTHAETEATIASGWKAGLAAQQDRASEDLIAREFTARYGTDVLYDHGQRCWFIWNAVCWRRDDIGTIRHQLREIARELGKGKSSISKSSVVAGAERLASSDPVHAVRASDWNLNPYVLGTPAGIVDLKTGQRRTARPEDRLTKNTSSAPEAGDPVLWLRFLHEALGADDELICFMQRMCGYLLTGSTSEHAIFFIYGTGKNGKSVFLNTIRKIMSDYAITAPVETFTAGKFDRHPTELAMLKDARLVAASETEHGRPWAEARLKQLTGGDAVQARFMRQNFFEFTPVLKLVIVGNHQPPISTIDEAMRRRLRIVPFTRTPARPDPELEERLAVEHPKILNWMIEGCLMWQLMGLGASGAVNGATDNYFSENDDIQQWLDECCDTGSGLRSPLRPLFDSWNEQCRATGNSPRTLKWFREELHRRGFCPSKANGVRYRVGLTIRNAEECEGTRWSSG